MEFLIIILVIFIALIIRGVFIERKKRLEFISGLKASYGKYIPKDYKFGKVHRRAVFDLYKGESFLDDITWNDLDMDRVYERIDSCRSAIGE